MNIVEKIKREPRMLIAVVNFVSFFLPWIAVNASAKAGKVSSEAAVSATGFGIMDYSIFGVIFYLIPIILFCVPLISQAEKYAKYLYLILPIAALVLMLMIGAIISGASPDVNVGSAEVSTDVDKLIGYWIALVCNIAVIGFTLMKDYNISSGKDIKENIQNIDMAGLASQVQNKAKDIGNSVQAMLIECPNCGNKVAKGKKFCSKCGSKVAEEVKFCGQCGNPVGQASQKTNS